MSPLSVALLVLAALAAGSAAGWWLAHRAKPSSTGFSTSDDAPALLEWILRANQGQAVWMVGTGIREVAPSHGVPEGLDRQVGEILDHQRMSDGQGSQQVDGGILLYASMRGRAAGLLLAPRTHSGVQALALRDLARMLEYQRPVPSGRLGAPSESGETVDSVAIRLAYQLERVLGVEACVGVARVTGVEILGVSTRSDRRLLRSIAQQGSVLERVAMGTLPAQASVPNPFGNVAPDSRLAGDLAYVAQIPGTQSAVVIWTHLGGEPDGAAMAALNGCLDAAGPRMAGALARRTAAEQAVRDSLTGLLNEAGVRAVMSATASGNGALIAFRLDNLRMLQDELGPGARDSALLSVSRLLLRGLRGIDSVGRIDAERFVLWLPRASFERARQVAERIRQALTWSDWEWDGKRQRISGSFGIASCPETGTREQLWTHAEQALDAAVQEGGDRVISSVSRNQ